VLAPGLPPVPLMVLPFESVPPGEPPTPVAVPELAPAELPPAAPRELCARASEQLPDHRISIVANLAVRNDIIGTHQVEVVYS
jgi:hypothetical protein